MSAFDSAATFLTTSTQAVSTSQKLELYGLFKCVTISSQPTTARPSIFDFTGRAKWDAWATAGKTYSDKADAESRYLEIAKSLGWTEGLVVLDDAVAAENEDIWDSEEEGQPAKRGEGGGMGVAVSAMSRPETVEDPGLHGAVVSNSLDAVTAFEQDPAVDWNGRDEFGYTPLHLAADRGHLAIVQYLLNKGADRSIKVLRRIMLHPYELKDVSRMRTTSLHWNWRTLLVMKT